MHCGVKNGTHCCGVSELGLCPGNLENNKTDIRYLFVEGRRTELREVDKVATLEDLKVETTVGITSLDARLCEN